MSLARSVPLASIGCVVVLVAIGCGGNAVLDAPDPSACASGHGCPMVGCACADGAVVLDTTCERGECLAPEEVCADRCEARGGAVSAFATETDRVAVPGCDTFCQRLAINGCELGCDTLVSECLAPSSCDPTAGAFWGCVVNEAVISCDDNTVFIEGCDASAYGLCAE